MAVPASEIGKVQVERLDADGASVLRLEGDFDREAARLLRAIIEQLPPGDVVLDFSRTRNFRDLAVPMLTRGLENRSVRVTGLPRHQQRVFQYFGWSAQEPLAKPYYEPEGSLGN